MNEQVNEPATSYCVPSKRDLTGCRIVVMSRCHGDAKPLSVHDSLDGAMADIGKRAADLLLDWSDTAATALYLVTVER